jgi:hypothetical protein
MGAARRGRLRVACPGPPFRPENVEGFHAGIYFVYDRPDSQLGPASCPRETSRTSSTTAMTATVRILYAQPASPVSLGGYGTLAAAG